MTALDEERCRTLVERLCAGLGWNVWTAPAVRYVLFDRAGRWITFGQSMSDVVKSLYDRSYPDRSYPDVMPAWMRECSSLEELALKAEVAL